MPMHIMHTAATTRPYLSRRQRRATGTTTSRINGKTRAGRAVQRRARFNDGRALGQPRRPAPRNKGWPGCAVPCSFSRRTNARTAKSTSRGNRKTRAIGPCRALSSTTDQRTDGPVGRSNSTKNPLNESQRHEKSADWGSSAMHCVIYISTTRPEFGRPTLAERSVYSKCVVPNNGLIVSLPRPP
jgi:hypothetical protein